MAYSYTAAVGDGSTTTFTFSFTGPDEGYYDESQIKVYVDSVEAERTLSGPNQITLSVAPADSAAIMIVREPDITDTYTNFARGNNFGKDNLNRAFQQTLYLIQRIQDGFYDIGSYLKQALNMGNHKITNLADGTADTDAVTFKQLEDRMPDNLGYYEGSLAAQEAAEAAALSSSSFASEAERHATTAAGHSADALTHAGEASAFATSAQGYSSSAAASALACAATLDGFDDRYLGAKASSPTLDNDGNALLDGALYWNTVSASMMVYNLSTTSWSKVGSSIAAHDLTYTLNATGALTSTVGIKLDDIVSVADFTGYDPTGATSSVAAFHRAFASLGEKGGVVFVPSEARCLIDTNLVVPHHISIVGPHRVLGTDNNNTSTPYGTLGGCLIVNPSYTITLDGSASLSGLLLHRKGMTFPAPNPTAFAGTAITLIGDDAGVFNCMILGFSKAIYSIGWQRPRLYDLNIDCLNGIHIDTCYDISYVRDIHCWPFSTIPSYVADKTVLQRSGTAYKFSNTADWCKVTNCFSYGYYRGFVVDGCNSMTLANCGADSTGSFSGQIGFDIIGTSYGTKLMHCQTAAQDTGYHIDTSVSKDTTMSDCDSWSCSSRGVLVDGGDVYIRGGFHIDSGNGVYINDAASNVFIDKVRFREIRVIPIGVGVATTKIILGDNNYGAWAPSSALMDVAFGIPTIASADPLPIPHQGSVFQVTGTTSFGQAATSYPGRIVTLKFSGILTMYDGGSSLKLNGNFVTSANATITMVYDGSSWRELARVTN